MTMTTVIHKTGLGVSIAGAALAAVGALMHSPAIWQPGLGYAVISLPCGSSPVSLPR